MTADEIRAKAQAIVGAESEVKWHTHMVSV